MPPRAIATPPIVSHPFARDIGQLDRAVNDLRRRAPDLSAATPLPGWQRVALLLAPSGLSAGCVLLEGPGLAAMLLTTMTALSSGLLRRLLSVIWLPIYWLAISYAAYRAVVDFIVRPFYWEKTPHGTGLHKLVQPHGRRAGESFAAMPLPDLERARGIDRAD